MKKRKENEERGRQEKGNEKTFDQKNKNEVWKHTETRSNPVVTIMRPVHEPVSHVAPLNPTSS